MALNRSDKSRILRRYFPGMTRNSEMSTEPSKYKRKINDSSLDSEPPPSYAQANGTHRFRSMRGQVQHR